MLTGLLMIAVLGGVLFVMALHPPDPFFAANSFALSALYNSGEVAPLLVLAFVGAEVMQAPRGGYEGAAWAQRMWGRLFKAVLIMTAALVGVVAVGIGLSWSATFSVRAQGNAVINAVAENGAFTVAITATAAGIAGRAMRRAAYPGTVGAWVDGRGFRSITVVAFAAAVLLALVRLFVYFSEPNIGVSPNLGLYAGFGYACLMAVFGAAVWLTFHLFDRPGPETLPLEPPA